MIKNLPIALLMVCLGCSETESQETQAPEPIKPDRVEYLSPEAESIGLDEAPGRSFHVLSMNGTTLLGGDHGLLLLDNGETRKLESSAITGLVPWLDGALFGSIEGLFYWDGDTVTPSPLLDALPSSQITALAKTAEDLWLATPDALHAVHGDDLLTFPGTGGTQNIATSETGVFVVFTHGSTGALSALEMVGEEWFIVGLGSGNLQAAQPGEGRGIYGLAGDQLLYREESLAGTVHWRPVSLSAEQDAPTNFGVIGLTQQQGTSTVWALGEDYAARLGTEVMMVSIAETSAFSVDTEGTIWTVGENSVLTYSTQADGPDEIVTWENDIEEFMQANCIECHAPLSTAPELYTKNQWSASIDEILVRLENGSMPPGARTLIEGDISLVRAWQEGGQQ